MSSDHGDSKTNGRSVLDETTPLLAVTNLGGTVATNAETVIAKNIEEEQGVDDEDADKPLPMGQMLLLCYVRIVEPIAVCLLSSPRITSILKVGKNS